MTSWYNASWSRRLKVTIDHDKVGSNLSDFPLPILGEQITDDRFWFAVLSTGADIVVTLADGVTKLKRELVSIDVSAKTMELYVRVPVLSSTVDTVLYLYYGNAAGAETNDTDTWINSFKMVQHMNDDPDTSTIQDSTSNNYDGTKKGAAEPAEAAGAFSGDKAQYHDSTDDYISFGDNDLVSTLGTFSFIVNKDTNKAYQTYLAKWQTAGNQRSFLIYGSAGGTSIRLLFSQAGTTGDFDKTPNEMVFGTGVWTLITIVFKADDYIKCYLNGNLVKTYTEATDGIPNTIFPSTADLRIGKGETTGDYLDGLISEARITDSELSADWIAAEYESLLGYATFLSIEYDSTYWGALALTPSRTEYKIEIRDNNGLNARRIVDIEQGTLDQQVNNPAAASLVCPMSPAIEAALSSIQRPNQLWITKNDTLFYTGNFSLIDIAHSSLESVRIDSLDWMNQLKDEFVEYYDAEDTVDDHVEAFLAEQVDVRPVLLGTIEPTLTRDLTIERDTIYNALMSMRDSVGGYMTVDPYHKLNWYWTLSESTGQQIRYRKNLVGITKSIDWMNFGNKLYIYGDGVDLTDAGYATTYIQDATSIATYGLVIRKIYKQSYASADTMLNYAYLKIQEMAFPRITYTVDIANLEDFGFSEDELTLGTWVTLIDEEIGVNVDVQIVRIIWDLVRCEKVQIELAVKSSDICDIVPGVYIL